MKRFMIEKPEGFRLAAATAFYEGFTPGSGMAAAAVDRLTLAFRLDGSFAPIVASLSEEANALCVHVEGSSDERAVARQLGRILGLEVDGAAWLDLGKKNAMVGTLQNEFPGFFTAAKGSPYDAATWAVIAPRMNMKQAAKIKMAIARELGDAIELEGRVHHVFPSPRALAQLEAFPGLSDEKVARLRSVAEAARRGKLDADHLRAMKETDALAELQEIRGVGPWAASHIYHRGAAPTDALPTVEPRVLHGYADVTGDAIPTEATFHEAAEAWRPFRMWVCVLLSRHLARTDKWRGPSLAKERAAAGAALARKTRRLSA